MSTVQSAPVLNSTVEAITIDTQTYLPAVMAGVQAAQVTQASGADKKQAVVDAIIAGSASLASSTAVNPNVSAIAALVDLTVSILKSLNVFGFSKTVAS